MKKSLVALAALAATGAFAQSSVTISGSINVGVMDTGLAGATAQVANLGGGANAINIVTVEDLGGGLRAGFDGQIRFNAATGDRNSQGTGSALFHGANAYLGGKFGTVRVGKIIEASNCAMDPWACTGGAGLAGAHPGSISGLIGAVTQAQSVSYTTPTINGFSGSYQTSVSARANERSILNLNYAQGPIAVQYLRSESSTNVALDGGTITDVAGKGVSIGASYDFKVAKVNVFNAETKNAANAVTADVTAVGLTVPMGAYTLLGGYAKDKKRAANADTKIAAGVNYALSRRTTLGADVFKSEAAGGSTGYVARIRHTF